MGDDGALKTLIIAGATVVALLLVLSTLSSAFGVKGPEVPGIPGVTGKKVCDVIVIVSGIWNHVPIPGWMDEVKILDVTYTVQNWRTVLYSFQPLGWSEGDGEMKIVYDLTDVVGNSITKGEVQFTGTQAWSKQFTLYKVEPGGYKLKVEVWMNTKALLWSEWVLKDSRTVDLNIASP